MMLGLKSLNWEADYIHILFDAMPSTSLVRFINAYKTSSSRIIKKDYHGIKGLFGRVLFRKQVILSLPLVEQI